MEAAWQHFAHLADQDRLAHAYLVVGAPATSGRAFALRAARRLLCLAPARGEGCACSVCHRIETGAHGDFHWTEPQGRSRQILVEQVEVLLRQIYETSFEGGWKIFALSYAERIAHAAGNKLLKALEEPPPRTLLLLLTHEPQSVLGTLVSRCQRLTLHDAESAEAHFWEADLRRLLEQGPAADLYAELTQAADWREMLDRVKTVTGERVRAPFAGREDFDEEALEARVVAATKEEYAAIFSRLERWYRDLLVLRVGGEAGHLLHPEERALLEQQAARMSVGGALRRLRGIERIAARVERNIPVQVAFENGLLG
jgi:DNA polymerase-3 subunit delta'